jgi:hypothetical protein
MATVYSIAHVTSLPLKRERPAVRSVVINPAKQCALVTTLAAGAYIGWSLWLLATGVALLAI